MSKRTIEKYSFLSRLFLSIFAPKKLQQLDEVVETANETVKVINDVNESADLPDAYTDLFDELDK